MKEADATEEFFALTVYALLALDSLALHLIQDNSTKPFPNDPEMVHHVDPIDAKRFMDFLTGLVKRYKKQSP
jgi:hypothetical protein